MNRVLRALISLVSIVVLILVITIALLVTVVNPNDFKPEISQAIQKYTGRNLSIKGKIHWSFFPSLGLKVDRAYLANPSGFNQPFFASIGQVNISIKLLPMFTGHIELGKINLKDASINLIKNKAGQKNWQTFTNTKSSTTKIKTSQTLSNTKTFTITNINVNNANINYLDQQTGQSFNITGLTLISKNVKLGKSFNGTLRFTLKHNDPSFVVKCNLNGKFKIDFKQNQYQAKTLKTELTVSDQSFPTKQVTLNLLADKANVNLKQGVLTLENLSLNTAGFNASGNITGKNITTTPLFSGSISIMPSNLRKTLAKLGYPLITTNQRGYNKFSANFNFLASPKFIKIQKLNAKLDNTTLRGNINYAILGDKSLNFNLNINQLKLNDYSIKSFNTSKTSSSTQSIESNDINNAKNSSLPIKINGNVTIKRLITSNITLDNVEAQLSGTNKLLIIDPMTANIYGGSMRSTITANYQSNYPRYKMRTTLSNIKMQYISKKSPIIGPANIAANITTYGNTKKSQLSNLNGNLSFKATNGKLKNINIDQILQKIASFINTGKKSNSATSKSDSSFSILSATATIKNGLVRNNNLMFISPQATIRGSGTVNLVTERLNYYVKLIASANIENSKNNSLINISNVSIPIRITGTFSQPTVLPDFGAIAGLILQNKIKKGISTGINLGKIIPESAGKTIQKGLESIFGK